MVRLTSSSHPTGKSGANIMRAIYMTALKRGRDDSKSSTCNLESHPSSRRKETVEGVVCAEAFVEGGSEVQSHRRAKNHLQAGALISSKLLSCACSSGRQVSA